MPMNRNTALMLPPKPCNEPTGSKEARKGAINVSHTSYLVRRILLSAAVLMHLDT
jgi:hypothetical protein